MSTLLPYPRFKAVDASGVPIVGGHVHTYLAGSTTDKPSYTTKACNIENTNPVVLDANGEATIFLNGNYKIVLENAVGAEIWTLDNVNGMRDIDDDAPWYDSSDYATLALADAAAYAAGKLLVISTNWTLVANTTLTASVKVIPGGTFTKASTYTLAFSGSFENPSNGQCFIDFSAGDVTFAAKLISEIWVNWWGLISDATNNGSAATGTDASPAFQAAIKCAEDSGIHTVKYTDGRYYFASVVSISRIATTSTKIQGPSMALQGRDVDKTGWITGAAGLKTLFDIGNSNNASWSAVAIDGVFLLGYTGGPISGIEYTGIGNSAGRPMSITNSTIEVFTNGVLSSESQSATRLSIKNCCIQANTYNIRSTHSLGIFDISITDNILENAGAGSIYGYFSGALNITDNLMESSVGTITILPSSNLSHITIERNNFENCTGVLVDAAATAAASTIRIAQNYYTSVSGSRIILSGFQVDLPEPYDSHGIKVQLTSCTKVNLTDAWSVYDNTIVLSGLLAPESILYNSLSPLSPTAEETVSVAGAAANTPLGSKTFINQTTLTAAINVTNGVNIDEYIAITGFLRKTVASTADTVTVYIYDPATVYVTAANLPNIGFQPDGKWIPFFIALKAPAAIAGNWKIKIGVDTGGVFDLTDMYVYSQVYTKKFWPYIPNTGW